MLEMGKDLLLHHPIATMGRFRPFCSLAWLEAGFCLAGRGMFVGAQKLSMSYGDGGVPPSLCTCNQRGTRLTTHLWHCVARRLLEDGLLSRNTGAAAHPPHSPRYLPAARAETPLVPIPRGGGGCFFLVLFLNFDFSSCEKWDCNISVRRASCS